MDLEYSKMLIFFLYYRKKIIDQTSTSPLVLKIIF